MTYSFDLRIRVINYILVNNISVSKTSEIYNVDKSTIYRWMVLNRAEKLKPLHTRKQKISIQIKFFIRDYVIKRIHFCYKSLLKLLKNKYNLVISKTLLYKTLKQLKISRKKIYKRPLYSNKVKLNRQKRLLKNSLSNVDIKDIISIDETSVDTHMENTYGWSRKGVKIDKMKKNVYKRYTVICAISNNKVIHYKIIQNSANGESFLDFIKELLTKINGNKYLLLDNARIHHYSKLKEYLKTKQNIRYVYNVPYSPQYNPIEYMFNEFKMNLKKCIINNKNVLAKINKCLKIKTKNLNAYFKKSLDDLYI